MSSYIGTFIDSEIYFLTELAISWLVISLSETNDRLFLCVVDQTSLPCLATFKKKKKKKKKKKNILEDLSRYQLK